MKSIREMIVDAQEANKQPPPMSVIESKDILFDSEKIAQELEEAIKEDQETKKEDERSEKKEQLLNEAKKERELLDKIADTEQYKKASQMVKTAMSKGLTLRQIISM